MSTTAENHETDAAPPPAIRRKKAWRKPLAFRPDRRSTAGRRQRAHELALCHQIGTPYSRLPVWMRSMVDSVVLAMIRLEQLRTAQSRGLPIDDEQAQRWAGILSRGLETLGLVGEGQQRRKAAEAEAERKRLLDQHYPNRTWDR